MANSQESTLTEEAAGGDPLPLFARWLTEAETIGLVEPSAMVLATVNSNGAPSARVVLLRGLDERGFVFYTNYLSRKGDDLTVNPRAALTFYWDSLRRQVRIEGTVVQVSAAESDAYFQARPVGHQLSAIISPQSQVVPDRAYLERTLADLTRKFANQDVSRPATWGGYRLTPQQIEFWQGRENRLHDRLRFRKQPDGTWLRERLAP